MTAATIANGLTIEYDEHGEGEPLLLVMGLGGAARRVAARLRRAADGARASG